MIDLYTWGTPNGRKVSIMLEETSLPYTVHPVNIGENEQFDPKFLAISPNNKIPAIYDHDTGISLMESGAILLYLAQKSGQFLPEGDGYWKAIEWLMWQMGGAGPILGQVHHFHHFNPGVSDYAQTRFKAEAERLYTVLDKQLAGKDYIATTYSIADMAVWPWISRFEWQGMDLSDYPNVQKWYESIAQRPAVIKGYHIPTFVNDIPTSFKKKE
ncbi:glutathione S-transferase family protein [Sneathiella sp.]|jgi:GST-like protein|uniref:glutathione S-transferase family protein n=1 Tax=Sneathiella sp. TaxID=1964365 RepID=UPI0039E510BB